MGQVESTQGSGSAPPEENGGSIEIETEFGDFDFIPSLCGKNGGQNWWTFKEALSKFSNSLIPPPPVIRSGKEAVLKVFEILKKNRTDVARIVIGGSGHWQSTNSSPPLLEAILFLNCPKILEGINNNNGRLAGGLEEPPFRKILTEFVDLLRRKDFKNEIKILTSTQPSQCIRIEVSNHRIDLWPAPNLKTGSNNNNDDDRDGADEQATKILDLIGKCGQQLRASNFLNAGLAESCQNWVKGQTPFAHAVVRLAEFWDEQLLHQLDDEKIYFVPGRHYLIQVLAIFAANSVASNNISEAIELFLERMSNLGSLRIIGDNWRSSRDPQVRSIVKRWMNKPTPVVLDPVNPYNNLTWFQHQQQAGSPDDKTRKSEIIQIFENHAKNSLTKLKQIEWPGKRHCSFDNVANIFGQTGQTKTPPVVTELMMDDVVINDGDWHLVPSSGVER